MFTSMVPEPQPWKEHAVVWTPWKQGTCACGRHDWLRYHWEARDFACLACWLAMPATLRHAPYHGYEDDLRLVWLWEQMKAGLLRCCDDE
jgi:hypothetical protein